MGKLTTNAYKLKLTPTLILSWSADTGGTECRGVPVPGKVPYVSAYC